MRLFYDRYTTRRQGDFLLLIADVLASVSVILYASRICYHEARGEDAFLLAVWAATPRLVARYFEWLHKPRDFAVTLLFSALFVLGCLSLVLVGVDLLWEAALPSERVMHVTMMVLLLTWFSGFLLYSPTWYRFHDALLGTTIVLGLYEHSPQPLLWVPLALLGMCLSQTVRHQLLDVFRGVHEPPLNLQNARTAGGLAALGASVIFAGVFAVTYPWLDSRAESHSVETGDPPTSLTEAAFGRPEPRPNIRRYRERGRPGGGSSGGSVAGGTELPGVDAIAPGVVPPPPFTRPGLQPRFNQDLFHRDDPRVVMVVHPLEGTAWRPKRNTLWRARSFSRFDPEELIWKPDAAPSAERWPDSRTIPVAEGTSGRFVELAVEIINPAFVETVIAPYSVSRLGPILRTPSDEFFYRGPPEDVSPAPPFTMGTTYLVRFRPEQNRLSDPGFGLRVRRAEPVYHEVPSEERAGVNLEEIAKKHLRGSSDLGACLDRLRTYWRTFRYSESYRGTGDRTEIATFILDRKVGSCLHFATVSALLLRAGGFSTRLAVGFLGGETVPTENTIVVRAESAHAWIEVYAGSRGWIPIDPTAWVPLDPDFVPSSPPGPGSDPDGVGGVTPGSTPGDSGDPGTDEPGALDPDAMDPPVADRGQVPPRPQPMPPWLTDRDVPIQDRIRRWRADEEVRRTQAARTGPSGAPGTAPPEEPTAAKVNRPGGKPQVETPASNPRRTLLRLALLIIGGLAVFLAVASILRPRPPEESDEEDEEDHRPPEPLGGSQIAAPGFKPHNPREEVLHLYHILQLELAWIRQHRRSHETPIEHARRFWGKDDALDLAFGELVRQVYDALFASRTITDKEVTVTRQACDVVRKHLS